MNYPENLPQVAAETMTTFSHNSRSPGQGLNLKPPKHQVGLADSKLLGSICSWVSSAALQ